MQIFQGSEERSDEEFLISSKARNQGSRHRGEALIISIK